MNIRTTVLRGNEGRPLLSKTTIKERTGNCGWKGLVRVIYEFVGSEFVERLGNIGRYKNKQNLESSVLIGTVNKQANKRNKL